MQQFTCLFTVRHSYCLPSARVITNRWPAARVGVFLVLCILALTGCFRRAQPANMTFDLKELLPAEWSAVGAVHEINIDNDDAVERLVFFSYDKSPQTGLGPIGALIYDLHEDKSIITTEGQPVANQSSSSLVRYQILPSYWQGAGQGFVAEPDQAANIQVNTVTYNTIDGTGANVARKELVVRGGNTHLTFIWWKGTVDGYGVTQLVASGGFRDVNWTDWGRTPEPILKITGLYPLHERSLLCRRVGYDRADVAPRNVTGLGNENIQYRQDIHYNASNRGLDFCDGAPTYPFYAEGVVLAYLLDPANRMNLLDTPLQSSAELTRVQSVIEPARLILVDDVRGAPELPIARADALAPGASVETSVCAKIITWTDAQLTTFEPRWLLFTLRHQLSKPDAAAIDQLVITSVNRLTNANGGAGLDCTQVMQQFTK
ncbi:MAG: hypothetical protein U0350_48070 [Caldilineaceae bacterium]